MPRSFSTYEPRFLDASASLRDVEQPHLLVGRADMLAYFAELFAEVRVASDTETPTLGILPAVRGLRVEPLEPGAAVVTFPLSDGPEPGRRSVVWRWNAAAGSWQIAHLHASRLTRP